MAIGEMAVTAMMNSAEFSPRPNMSMHTGYQASPGIVCRMFTGTEARRYILELQPMATPIARPITNAIRNPSTHLLRLFSTWVPMSLPRMLNPSANISNTLAKHSGGVGKVITRAAKEL